jgi:uncharacterized protein YciI
VQHFIATYAYSDDLDKRDAFRAPHRTWLADQTELLVSGPTDDDGAVLIFRGESAAEVSALLDQDPFTVEGVVTARTIRAWDPVVGSLLPVFLGQDAAGAEGR